MGGRSQGKILFRYPAHLPNSRDVAIGAATAFADAVRNHIWRVGIAKAKKGHTLRKALRGDSSF
jgi:hypothetical protein